MIAFDEKQEEKINKEKKFYFIVQLCFCRFLRLFHRSKTTKTKQKNIKELNGIANLQIEHLWCTFVAATTSKNLNLNNFLEIYFFYFSYYGMHFATTSWNSGWEICINIYFIRTLFKIPIWICLQFSVP